MTPSPESRRTPEPHPLTPTHARVGAACLLAVPIATWFLMGERSEPGGMDRMYSVPSLPRPLEIAIGLVALAGLIVGMRYLIPRTRATGERAWWEVFKALAVAGFLLAWGGRVLTARVNGANLGGGMFLIVGLPLIGAVLLWAAVRAWKLMGPGAE